MGCPSGQREQTVNLPAYAYEGSNPSPTIAFHWRGMRRTYRSTFFRTFWFTGAFAGVAQLVEH